MLSALGGVLLGPLLLIDPDMGFISFKSFTAVVLGGFGSLPGAVLGGILLGLVENLAAGYIGHVPAAAETDGLLRLPVGPSLQRGWPPPFAPWALPDFRTTTEESAPAWLIGISASRFSRLCLFPWHRQTGSQVPYKSLDEIHALYTPDTAWPVCRSPPRSSRGMRAPPVLMSPQAFRCVCEDSLALVSLIHT